MSYSNETEGRDWAMQGTIEDLNLENEDEE